MDITSDKSYVDKSDVSTSFGGVGLRASCDMLEATYSAKKTYEVGKSAVVTRVVFTASVKVGSARDRNAMVHLV